MTDDEREELRIRLHGNGHGPRPRRNPRVTPPAGRCRSTSPARKTRPLLISSGKGGVGKSSVTTNLAVALAARGHSVGVVDADIYGFSIPRMLGADTEPVVIDQMLVPPESWGVRCISIGYFVPEGQAVIWRGPMLHKALEQFLADVFWDDPDFLLVDMPPGTGDIAISLSQYLPRGEVYVVTTPQPAAQQVARLSAAMAAKVNLTVRGVIENMSWFTGDDGKRYELFGSRRRRRPRRRARRAAARPAAARAASCARAATTAGRSPPSTPTARPVGRSTSSPSASPSSCARRRSSATPCACRERRRRRTHPELRVSVPVTESDPPAATAAGPAGGVRRLHADELGRRDAPGQRPRQGDADRSSPSSPSASSSA